MKISLLNILLLQGCLELRSLTALFTAHVRGNVVLKWTKAGLAIKKETVKIKNEMDFALAANPVAMIARKKKKKLEWGHLQEENILPS